MEASGAGETEGGTEWRAVGRADLGSDLILYNDLNQCWF